MAYQDSQVLNSLKQFQLTEVSYTEGTVEESAYATVRELEFQGLKCVGKKIQQVLFDSAKPQEKAAMLKIFVKECDILSCLRHPCVVQFLGIDFEDGSQLPVLITEYLHTSLSACLDRYGILPEAFNYNILHDVALGMNYLHKHSPPIIHKNLSANTVLLTSSMSAKISGLGVLNVTPAQVKEGVSTQLPGSPCYTPPEALMARQAYTSQTDSYSYGVLIIHIFCGRWPHPADAFCLDPQNPGTVLPVSEVDRRAEYLRDIGQDHPLMELIEECLSNVPSQRPETSVILRTLDAIMSRVPLTHQSNMEMQIQIESLTTQVEQLSIQNQEKQGRIEFLTAQTQEKYSKMEALRAKVEQLSARMPQRKRKPNQPQLKPKPKPRSRPPQQPRVDIQPQADLLNPQVKLQWRKVANMPVEMNCIQAVVVKEMVCVAGGVMHTGNLVLQYNPAKDEWTTLPPCPVSHYCLGMLLERLIAVGGLERGTITGKVYCYKSESQEWKEFFQAMPTPRTHHSIINTQSALIACGGVTGFSGSKPTLCTTVEVYSTEQARWYATDPLPFPCMMMSSTTITNTGYFLGGVTTNHKPLKAALCAPVASLIQKATSHSQQLAIAAPLDSTPSAWKTLQDAPLYESAVVSLGGMLLAIGGKDDQKKSAAVHVYSQTTSSWVRATSADLPDPRTASIAVELSASRLLVIGGRNDDNQATTTVFLGSLATDY